MDGIYGPLWFLFNFQVAGIICLEGTLNLNLQDRNLNLKFHDFTNDKRNWIWPVVRRYWHFINRADKTIFINRHMTPNENTERETTN